MRTARTRIVAVLILTAALGVVRADEGYTLTCGGQLAIMDGQVVVTRLAHFQNQVWHVEISAGQQRLFTNENGKKLYLTANQDGEVFAAEKPTDGSYWGLDLPKGDKKTVTWIGNGLRPGPRCLRVDFANKIKRDGKEIDAHRVHLGKAPDPEYDRSDPRFVVSGVAP